jgi:hypothetical protein
LPWKDEAGTAAILTVELDASLGGRAVQYREVQGNETEKLLTYFRPCIMPQPGGVASGFNHVEVNEQEHVTRLYVCRGSYVVHVKEVSYLNQCLSVFNVCSLLDFGATLQTRFLLLVRRLTTTTYLFWIPSPKFSSSMAPTHAFKREQKLLKLCSISKTLSMRESVKSLQLVSNSDNVP